MKSLGRCVRARCRVRPVSSRALTLALALLSQPVLLIAQKVLSAEEVFKKVSPSVFGVEIYDGQRLVGSGSAVAATTFVISEKDGPFAAFDHVAYPDLENRAPQVTDVVVTNCHVWSLGQGSRSEPKYLIRRGKAVFQAFVAGIDTIDDLAWLVAPGLQAPRVRLRESTTLSPGERVYALGSPMGLENTITEGIISGVRGDSYGRLVQTNAAISHGSSGGGLFDRFGSLIGVTQFTLADGQNLNFAIPAEKIVFFETYQDGILQRGQNLAEQNDRGALSACDEAFKISSDEYRRALSDLCYAHYFLQVGELKGAEEFARQALKAYGHLPLGHYMLGQIHEKAQRNDEAFSEYQIASKMDPSKQGYKDAMNRVRKAAAPLQSGSKNTQ